MKIRQDFVTNSSSSSFILSFKDESSVKKTIKSQFPAVITNNWSDRDKYISLLIREVLDEDNQLTRAEAEGAIYEEKYTDIWCEMHYRLIQKDKLEPRDADKKIMTKECRAEMDRQCWEYVKSIMESIGDDQIIVQIEHGSGGDGEDGVLENQALPNMACVKDRYNHH